MPSTNFPTNPSLDNTLELSILIVISSPYFVWRPSFIAACAMLSNAFAVEPIFLGGFTGPTCVSLLSSLGCSISTHLCNFLSNLYPAGHGSIIGLSGSTGCVIGGVAETGVSILPSPIFGNCDWSNCGNIPFSISFICLGYPAFSEP